MIALGSILLLVVALLQVSPCGVSPNMPAVMCTGDFTLPVLHRASNAFYFVGKNPFLVFTSSSTTYFFLTVILFFVGVRIHFSFREGLIKASLLTVAMLSLFGADAIVWNAIVFAPWLLWSIQRRRFFGSLFFSLLMAATAGASGILTSFLILMVACEHLSFVFFLVLFAPSTAALLFSTLPAFPHYPDFSRVLTEIYPPRDPWVGESLPVWLLNGKSISQYLLLPSLFGLLLTAFERIFNNKNVIIPGVLFFFVFLDAVFWFPESGGELLPVGVILRILPGMSGLPVQFLLFGLAIFAFGMAARSHRALFFVVAALLGISVSQQRPWLVPPVEEFSENERAVLSSPSAVVFQENKDLFLNRIQQFHGRKLRVRLLTRLEHTLFSSHQSDLLSRINTGDASRRWSPGKGAQTGDEWIGIRLKEPDQWYGVQLSSGLFHSDYARGVKVFSSPTCESFEAFLSSTIDDSQSVPISSMGVTPDGFPFYTSPSEGKYYFSAPRTVQCLLIRQTGTTPQFDWSISSIRFMQ